MTHIESVQIHTDRDKLTIMVWGQSLHSHASTLVLMHTFHNKNDGSIAPERKLSLMARAVKLVYTTYVLK